MKKIIPVIVLLSLNAVGYFVWANSAQADSALHIIINEIQIAGTSSNDEFIELFNPTNEPVNLEGYKLSKKTKTGSSESTLVSATKFSGIIQAHGYFLIAHPNYREEMSADLDYSGSTYYISDDNTILLYNESGILLDKVGFGLANDSENSPAENPNASQSIERKDFIDSDDNAADFSINTSPSPQNINIIEESGEELPDGSESSEDTENNNDTAPDTSGICATISSGVRLNEIFPYPENGDEFVEIVNIGGSCIDVSGWKVMDEAGHKKEFPENSILDPGEYLFLEGNLYLNNDSDTVYLLGRDGSTKNDALDSQNFEKARKDYSYSSDGYSWQWTSIASPGNENVFDADEDSSDGNNNSEENDDIEDDSPVENVFLNEILPNPEKKLGEEYVEIANDESGPVDLFGWKIKDASKSKGYEFKDHVIIESGEYLVIYKPESKISLNNYKESAYLFNSSGDMVSSVSYDKSEKNFSYSFNGENWRWSRYLTPGEKNKFDSEPSVKIKKIKRAYKDAFTEFSAKVKDKETKKGKLKYSWDFGDGGKSTLAKPTHKYLDTGKYTVTLSVKDDSQTVEKNLSLTVKEYPHPNIEVVRVNPNPPGKDMGSETIDLKNNSDKKVGLDGWKIATGSGENIYSHPLKSGINLDPKETKIIDQDISRFTLNNKSGRVQLVSPDGESVDEVEYEKEKIAEGEVYTKIDGEWQWISPPKEKSAQDGSASEENNNTNNNEETAEKDGEVLGATDENIPNYAPIWTSYTSEDAYIFFKQTRLLEYKSQKTNYCPANNSHNLSFLLAGI
jgi:PKD repeat protein